VLCSKKQRWLAQRLLDLCIVAPAKAAAVHLLQAFCGCVLLQILILLQASAMMVEVKKHELMHKARARAKADAAAGPATKKQQ
jgi:hypothetical protein